MKNLSYIGQLRRPSRWLVVGGIILNAVLFSQVSIAETAEHISQATLNKLLKEDPHKAYMTAFDVGDELFEHAFLASEGVGANVGNGHLFSIIPRADLTGESEWATHTPKRVTGPNAQSCDACHSVPFGDGAGKVMMNNIRDPLHTGDVSQFINRQPPHIFGIGALQLLAEEMSQILQGQVNLGRVEVQQSGQAVIVELMAKGVSFGAITINKDGTLDNRKVLGIDPDLLVKPIEWKGVTSNVRAFVRDAGHNELGMQATEMVGLDVDGDGDGVVNELSVGDITAMVIYQAAQPRPTTRQELASLGLIDPLTAQEQVLISQGQELFQKSGCDSCHKPVLTLDNSIYSEPSLSAAYRDIKFPSGQNPVSHGLSTGQAITFDLTKDLPDNIIELSDGKTFPLGNFEKDEQGRTIVRLFGDLKRHDMGAALAEAVDEVGTGAANFMTKELWGVGSTAPYLHDGRATTLDEAIVLHGGDSRFSQVRYMALSADDKNAVQAYLNNLVLYKAEEE